MPPRGRGAAALASQVDITVAAVLASASASATPPVASTSTSVGPPPRREGSDSDRPESATPVDSADADRPSTAGPERPKKKSQRPSWSVSRGHRRSYRGLGSLRVLLSRLEGNSVQNAPGTHIGQPINRDRSYADRSRHAYDRRKIRCNRVVPGCDQVRSFAPAPVAQVRG